MSRIELNWRQLYESFRASGLSLKDFVAECRSKGPFPSQTTLVRRFKELNVNDAAPDSAPAVGGRENCPTLDAYS